MRDKRESWGRIANSTSGLTWCMIFGFVVAIDGVPIFLVPAAIVATEVLRRLAPLLDAPAARAHVGRAAVAAGGVVVAGAMTFPASTREAARVALLLTLSVAVSLYALGLAAWTAPVGDGKLARHLHISVVAWWVSVAAAFVGYWTGSVVDQPSSERGNWVFDLGNQRDAAAGWVVLNVAAGVVALALLFRSHHIIRRSMEQLADEPAPDGVTV